jgi:hypothetical protein
LPDTLDPLVVNYPARLAQELGDLAIALTQQLRRRRLAAVDQKRPPDATLNSASDLHD